MTESSVRLGPATQPLPAAVLRWMAVAAHVNAYPHEARHGQSASTAALVAGALGFEGVSFVCRPRNDGQVSITELDGIQVTNAAGRPLHTYAGVEWQYSPQGGLEGASPLMPFNGLVLATNQPPSRPAVAVERLVGLMMTPRIDVLSSPTFQLVWPREVPAVHWELVFARAARLGVAVEVNWTGWRLRAATEPDWWPLWLELLATSRAPVLLSLGVRSPGEWPSGPGDSAIPLLESLQQFIELVQCSGITRDQVVNSSLERFDAWMGASREQRALMAAV